MSFKKVKIKDLVTLINGHAFKPEDWGVEGKRIIRIQNLNNPEASYNLTKKEVPEKYVVLKGDILIAWAGSLGVYEWEQEENALLNQHLFKVEFKTMDIDKSYFKYVIYQALTELEQKARGVGLKHLKKGQIDNYEFQLPEISEQINSVKILKRVEALISLRSRVVDLLDEYSISTFINLFGDPIVNSKQWEKRTLDQLGEWKSGGTPPRKSEKYYTNGSIPWFSSGELNDFYIRDSKEKIIPSAITETSVKLVNEGSLLIGMYDTAALKTSICTNDCSCNQAIAFSKLNDLINPLFVLMCIRIGKEFYLSKRKGARQKNLNLSYIKSMEIIFPPKNTQDKYNQIFEKTQIQKDRAEKSLQFLNELQQALIYETFSSIQKPQLDEIGELIEDDIQLELFLNTIKSSDFENEELYIKAIDDLFEILDRTQLRNQADSEYLKGIIQRISDKEIVLETNRENKYRLSDEAAAN